jgi:signal transduction histidine kinase
VTAKQRPRPVPRGAEVALALCVGTASFALVAVAVAAIEPDALVVLVGIACIAGVVGIERAWGIAYAVPAAMAALLAFDWYRFPPTHPRELPDAGNLANLFAYLGVGVLIGQLAAHAARRADASEAARSIVADEQAALRRVATLVARGVAPSDVFAAVAREAGELLAVDATHLGRYEADGTTTGVGSWSRSGDHLPIGTRARVEGGNVTALVLTTGRPARVDAYADDDPVAAWLRRETGIRSSVGAPIVVEGRLWGVMIASSKQDDPLPAGTETRIAAFTELVATAISNTEARSDLAASRARIVAAADDERRRVVRDLHDGAQQRLVHTVITLKLARQALQTGKESAPALLDEALAHAEDATDELRELAHGILPSVLVRGGLRAGVEALATRMPLPVETDVSVDRLPAPVEATAYFVVAEALTNVAKHSHAARAAVSARVEDGTLRLRVRDDGVGGAQVDGAGLVGLADRLAVLHGGLRVESPADGGTLVAAAIPLAGSIRGAARCDDVSD